MPMAATFASAIPVQPLAQKLMDDIRYIRPEAWLDWQYVEENNDQWCTVKGNFTAQTYQRVKNYYVRQQLSRYIPAGSKFLSVPNDQMLAALSPEGESLIIVLLNNSSMEVSHQIDLSLFDQLGNSIEATRTSETENNATISDYSLKDSTLSLTLPGYSITTLVIQVTINSSASNNFETDVPYLILSRTASLVMQTADNAVEINNYQYGDPTQLWKLVTSGNGYTITSLAGDILTDAGSYYAEASSIVNSSGQTFLLEPVGDDFFKIVSFSSGKTLDLEGQSNAIGTKIGFYAYGTSPSASHRQWMFVLPPFSKTTNNPNGVEEITESPEKEAIRVFGTDGAIVLLQTPGSSVWITVYALTGVRLLQQKVEGAFTRIPWRSGIYLVSHSISKKGVLTTTKVLVR